MIRIIIYSLLVTTFFLVIAAGSSAAVFSFKGQVNEFFGIAPTEPAFGDAVNDLGVTISSAPSNGGVWSGASPDIWTANSAGSNVSVSDIVSRLNAGTSVVINTAGSSGDGDILVVSSITWTSNSSLILNASRHVNINANITASGNSAGLTIAPNRGNSGSFNLNKGAVITLLGTTPALTIAGNAYSVINQFNGGITALQNINSGLSGRYALGTDIDASATTTWNGGTGFMPIGTNEAPFTGTFEGFRHTISNIFINRQIAEPTGFFGNVSPTGEIRNLGMAGGSVSGSTFESNEGVGGLVGQNDGKIHGSFSSVNATCVRSFAGSLAGRNTGTITQSFATGNVTVGEARGGGLAGQNNGTITDSFATGSVSGGCCANAGFVGHNVGTIRRSYSLGTASGTFAIGGFVGEDWSGGGSVYSDNYWNTTTSGISSSLGATGLTSAQMMQRASFSNWDLLDIWYINEGSDFPKLRAFSNVDCTTLPSEVVSLWRGEGNANDAVGTNNGTLIGGATYAAGKVGQAFSFNGTTAAVDIPDSDSLDVTNEFTLAAWVNPSTVPDYPYGELVISKIGGPSNLYGYQMTVTRISGQNQVWCGFNVSGGPWPQFTVTGGDVPVGSWSFISCTYDHNTLSVYVNGQQVGANSIGAHTVVISTSHIKIGSDDVGQQFYSGLIDEPMVAWRAMSPTEILAIFNAGSNGVCDPAVTPTPTTTPTATATPTATPTLTATVTPTPGSTCIPPLGGMVGWWPGDGNAIDPVHGNNGSMVNGVAFAPGKVDQAFSFVQANQQFIELPGQVPALLSNSAGSITAWVDPTAVGEFDMITAFGTGDPGQAVGFGVDNGNVRVYHHTDAFDWQTGVPVSIDTWTFLAYTWDATTERLYKNGTLAASRPRNFTYVPAGFGRIGFGFINDASVFFPGSIDEVAIFDRTLDTGEVSSIFGAGSSGMCAKCTPSPVGLISSWKGENNPNDQTGLNNGTWHGTPAYAAGKVGEAFSFDGLNYIEVPDSPLLRPVKFTVDAWVYPTNISGNHNVVFKGDHEYLMQLRNGNILFGSRDASGGYTEIQGSLSVPMDRWSHVAITHDGSTKRMYVNGVLDPVEQAQAGHYTTNLGPLRIGTHNSLFEFFYGMIDEVEVVNGALSQTEIQRIYGAGRGGKCDLNCTPTPQNLQPVDQYFVRLTLLAITMEHLKTGRHLAAGW